ncbi:transcription factor mef2A [Musca vetustissima]|uniref:transcription factor mef2A n=1 Tax=Musca vetustissima TaxID=27455 RepID=UPI002AB7A1DE|nr:transcription factor mef2A [Musca vetustissima]
MKMSKLSNQTNSQDPQAVNSRIFVGNLNTFQCSKTDVERMFQIYGRLAGISMHKGYAFVQFTNPFDARNACLGEDGKMVLSQTLDVNMVAEPKAHQVGRKRQNINKTGNDWDYFYDSYYASTMNRNNSIRPKKRKRLMSNSSRLVGLSDAVSSTNLNAAMAAASMAQQQQQLVQHQQQQQQHHQQQQAAVVAMAAMANLLPQQQMLLHHQQSMLTNANGTAATCNGATTAPHHASLSMYLQQQQQQHHQQQQQQAAAAAVAAAQYAAAATNSSLQLKMSSPLMAGPTGQAVASTNSLLTHDNDQLLSAATTTASNSHQSHLQQQQHTSVAGTHLIQPLSLSVAAQQQQQHQSHHHYQQQIQKHQQQQHQQQLQYEQTQQHQQQQQDEQDQLSLNNAWGPFKVYSNPDTLICGNCRECFNELAELLDHKRTYCKLRFTCKCQDLTMPTRNPVIGAKLLCAVCKDAFTNPWDLMVHAQAAHMVNIYELGTEPNNNSSNAANNNTANGNNNEDANLTGTDALASTANGNANEPPNNNGLHCNNTDNDSNNNNTKNHNGIIISRDANCFSLTGKMEPPITLATTSASSSLSSLSPSSSSLTTVANITDTDAGVMSCVANDTNNIACNGTAMSLELGHSSDTETHLELKFGICNSPIATINNKEEPVIRDDGSLDERMSDDVKILRSNGSVSSRGSTPTMTDNEDATRMQQRACIVRTLSFEAAATTTSVSTPPTTTATLGLITNNSLALGLNSSSAVSSAAAVAPQ